MKDFIFLPASNIRDSHVRLPGSKSISNRTLLLAALSDNECVLHDVLDSDDTQRMLEALAQLGVVIETIDANSHRVHGSKQRFPNKDAQLFLGNAGTAFRPLTAALALMQGHYELSGVPRMHERPIGDLVDALRLSGADITYLQNEAYPPLKIHPWRDNEQRTIPVKGNVSSQFLTALLMSLPLTGQAYTIEVVGELISKPYIDITLKLMAQFGIVIEHEQHQVFHLPANALYHAPESLHVEGDASSASYFLAAGLLTGKKITVEGINEKSIQGDVAFVDALVQIGAHVSYGDNSITVWRDKKQAIQAFDFDANHIPDAAMTLAIVAVATGQECHIRNIESWRVKETDRLSAMTAELRKLGVHVVEGQDYISIHAQAPLKPNVRIDTYDDHRMAMCFSLIALLGTPIIINEPECVNKTFPTYFEAFAKLCV
ncbi:MULTISPECIES: 3-phosphoshikimate 1-carboxyvinyltransferase [Vitreoscilla]|uniref:3-phosphoshikimate 1-carboxyvinyltransferase n=1 Tax=Vitreoscilla stercoraria TaxID=61 RepID=A0ABY4EER3_VITST|nr:MULTISPECIES: 3-phosphoshikimate 1-carboxyvinyltransferase [Vitreoscilla]AUZ05782.2 3-phosphoshikimate 1-carboxyvinyltransferase [Vitreoscilla sp. C1]UOO93679.1 3-phosphoshikimate 1-carboxyvinyltransferase [Vitreoscilla stercoraria]